MLSSFKREIPYDQELPLSITVVTYCTPDFQFFVDGIEQDCERLGMNFYYEVLDRNFRNVIKAFDYKIEFLEKALRKFELVVWLDVECRLHRCFPAEWSAPLISTYEKEGKTGMSSGVLLLNNSHLEMLSMWKHYAKKYSRQPDDFVLEFLINELSWDFNFVDVDFFDRNSLAPVVRGEWFNSATVVSHPSTNRWPNPRRYSGAFGGWRASRKKVGKLRKNLFYRNFSGDFQLVDEQMREGSKVFELANWIFDAQHGLYAPSVFWPEFKEDYFSKPRTFEQSKESFFRPQKGVGYREKMVGKMKLDRSHRVS